MWHNQVNVVLFFNDKNTMHVLLDVKSAELNERNLLKDETGM